ncbi:MAG: hypothetical protein ABIP39_15020 [Polyangiaceae bacterium]
MSRRHARRAGRAALFVALTLSFCGAIAFAQSKGPKRPPHPKKHTTDLDASALTARAEAPQVAARATKEDAGMSETRTIDGGTRVFRFGEVEIEGRLRSPQLVYFLRRVRAEFAAGDLGHRTFMRELSETRKDPNF